MRKDDLIKRISEASDKSGDKLIDFMARYGLTGLMGATEEQLKEYIEAEGIA